jgi:hypothetical protein
MHINHPELKPAKELPAPSAPDMPAAPGKSRWKGLRSYASSGRQLLLRATRGVRAAALRSFGDGFARFAACMPGALHLLLVLLRILAPRQSAIAQMHALSTARRYGWQASRPLFLRIEGQNGRRTSALALRLLAPARQAEPVDLCVPSDDRPLDLPPDMAARVVVYTACFGRRPYLLPLAGQPEGLRFICFTDTRVNAPGWEVIVMPPPEGGEALLGICPHRFLAEAAPDADWSLFLDHGLIPVGNLHTLVTRWLAQQDMVLWRHPVAGDWQGLAEHALLTGSHPAAAVLAQAEACAAAAIPRHQGASDTGLIWRRHSDPAVQAQMEGWWDCHAKETEGDPALSWYRVTHEPRGAMLRIAQMPAALGTARDNIFFARCEPQVGAFKPRLPAPALLTGRIPLTFLFAEERSQSGITLLRARQLSRMVAEAFPDKYDVTLRSDIRNVRDHVVIVNRGAIEFNTRADLHELRHRNIVSISDFLDMPIKAKTAAAFDAHMTLCLPQAAALNRLFPETAAFHVTHHVNPAVPECTPPADRLRTGYFGRPGNTSVPASLEEKVAMVNVIDASFTPRDWARKAPLYNCHWIVRQKDELQDWKPFLKGFVAARCGAVVIVTREDMNAMHYLGDDYPFYAESLAPEDLEWAWVRVASAFGGDDWRKAQAIMRQVRARSTSGQVMTEFRAMLDEILG